MNTTHQHGRSGRGGSLIVAATAGLPPPPARRPRYAQAAGALPGGYKHLVVIYEENHSFDNLYGGWGRVDGQQVEGLQRAGRAHDPGRPERRRLRAACCRTTSTSPRRPLPTTCTDPAHGVPAQPVHQRPVHDRRLHPPTATTCPAPGCLRAATVCARAPAPARRVHPRPGAPLLPGAVPAPRRQAGPLRHRQRRGRADHGPLRHQAAADLPLPARPGAPNYVIADHFFQAAFGGSFLNHQYLVAARARSTPAVAAADARCTRWWTATACPTQYPLYTPTGDGRDGQLTQACGQRRDADSAAACGNYAVNTIQPASPPFGGGAKSR